MMSFYKGVQTRKKGLKKANKQKCLDINFKWNEEHYLRFIELESSAAQIIIKKIINFCWIIKFCDCISFAYFCSYEEIGSRIAIN